MGVKGDVTPKQNRTKICLDLECLVIGRPVGTNLSGFQTYSLVQRSDNRTLCPVIGHSLYLKRLKTGRFQLDVCQNRF